MMCASSCKSDDSLVNILKKNKILYFRGGLKNVAKRLLSVAEKYNKKHFIRINADSPLIDFRLIDRSIKILKDSFKKKYDIIVNVQGDEPFTSVCRNHKNSNIKKEYKKNE